MPSAAHHTSLLCTSCDAGDMNWIPIDGVDKPVPLPPGWVDVWLELRPHDPGWTYDSQVGVQRWPWMAVRCYTPGWVDVWLELWLQNTGSRAVHLAASCTV